MTNALEHICTLGELRRTLDSSHPTLRELRKNADADKLFRSTYDGKWYLIPIESFTEQRKQRKERIEKTMLSWMSYDIDRGKISNDVFTLDLSNKIPKS